MMQTLYFCPSEMPGLQSPQPALLTSYGSGLTTKNHACNAFGILIAIVLHVLAYWLISNNQSAKDDNINPAQVIAVSWINNPTTQAISKPPSPAQKPAKSLPTPVKPTALIKSSHNSSLLPQAQLTANAADTLTPQPAPSAAVATVASNPSSSSTPSSESPALASSTNAAQVQNDSEPLSLPHLNADYLNNPAPVYPAQSKQLGEQGRVLVRVFVNSEGQVEQLSLRKSSGFERLDQAALTSVKQWRFVAAKRGQQTVSAWVVVPVSFNLEG